MVILVVDDDAPICELVATVLTEEGYRVLTASDGHTALAALAGAPEPPALIVLDLMLPQLTGVEVYRLLRQHPLWATIPVIVWTAIVPGGELQATLEGAHILRKPASIEVLLQAIEQLTGRSR